MTSTVTKSNIIPSIADGSGIAFLRACKTGSTEKVRLILEDGKLSSADLEKGYSAVCAYGHASLAVELKHNPQMTREALDEGYFAAYDAGQTMLMKMVEDKVSSVGIGKVFKHACKVDQECISEKLLLHPRLSIEDLQSGLSLAEANGLNLKSLVDSKTKIQLFLHNNHKFLLAGGLAAATVALYTIPKGNL